MRLPDRGEVVAISGTYRFFLGLILIGFACAASMRDDGASHALLLIGVASLLFKAAER